MNDGVSCKQIIVKKNKKSSNNKSKSPYFRKYLKDEI